MKKLLIVASFIISLIVAYFCGLLTFCIITYPTDKVIHTWKKDNDYKYTSGYKEAYLSVVEGDYYLGKIPSFSGGRRYYIYIGLDKGKPTYGHCIDYSINLYESDNNIEKYIKETKVEWQKDGVLYIEPTGHKLFIPEKVIGPR